MDLRRWNSGAARTLPKRFFAFHHTKYAPMSLPIEISCADVHELLQTKSDFVLLDCREPVEHRIAAVEQARLLPMSRLPERVAELADSRDRRIVVMCHHGVRSLQTAAWLRAQGFADAQSMQGGIDRWSEQIDPGVPRY